MSNKLYIDPEAAITFRPSAAGGGGTNVEVDSLAAGTGQLSDRADLGAFPRSGKFAWRAKVGLTGVSTVGKLVLLYLATSDGTIADGNVGTSGASISSRDSLRNLQYLGALTVDAAGSVELAASGRVDIDSRYASLAVWNDTDGTFTSTPADHVFKLYPAPDELE